MEATTSIAPAPRRALALVTLGALGVVYGDIGTSPLYAIKECLAFPTSPHAIVSTAATLHTNVLGVLSLIFWALVLVICVKYLAFVLRADNKGEGGILALAALVEDKQRSGRSIAFPMTLGLFGAGLLFGDGVITPAISVLGAMEGIAVHRPSSAYLILPISIGLLVALFLVQRRGTGKLGFAFGPVMLLWFLVIGALGLRWIIAEPAVLEAINPVYGFQMLTTHGYHGFLLLGLVFLVVTGGEALYAYLGRFGKRPLRIAWFFVALPGLLLNYFGQGAVLLSSPPGTVSNPFYALAEGPLLLPMLVLATMAAVIASQALISGVFAITRQAMQLGFWPRVTIVHTSARAEGQIYIPEMNWVLMVVTIAVVLVFRTSSGLAAAYGVAVTGTMAVTSCLFYLACTRRWGYSQAKALALLVPFLAIDIAFFAANAAKLADGGWFPIALGLVVFGVMTTWCRGSTELFRKMEGWVLADELLLTDIATSQVPRVPGTAVFMASTPHGMPNVLIHHLKHNKALHRQVILFSVRIVPVPHLELEQSVEIHELGLGFFRVIARVGFMQEPDVPQLLDQCASKGLVTEPMTTTYYLGRQTLVTTGTSRLARWRKLLFGFLTRNARPATAFFHLPPNRVVELGLRIEV